MTSAKDRLRELAPPEPVIPSLDQLDAAVLPPVSQIEILPPVSETREGKLDNSDRLDRLTDKALDFYDALLDEPLDPEASKLLNAQLTAAGAIINVQAKVDTTRLRKRQEDTLPKLLKLIAEEDARRKKLVA